MKGKAPFLLPKCFYMSGEVFVTVTTSLVIVINLEDDMRFSWFFPPYSATSCDQFTNGAVKKLTASCFMGSSYAWRRFAPWKLCQKITADTKQLYATLFVQDITTQLRSEQPRLFNKRDYRETLKLTKFSAYLSAIQVTAALPSSVLTFTLIQSLLLYNFRKLKISVSLTIF